MEDIITQFPYIAMLVAFAAGLFAQKKWLLWDKVTEKLK